MSLSKPKISPGELIAKLLVIRHETEEQVISTFKGAFEYSGDERNLVFETRIFSLWVLVLSLPPGSKRLRDATLLSFCKQLKLDDRGTQFFLGEIATRFKIYNNAYAKWQENRSQGSLLGSCIIKIIRDQDIDAVSGGKSAVVGAIEAMEAVMLFGAAFKVSIQAVGEIKRNYDSPELEVQQA